MARKAVKAEYSVSGANAEGIIKIAHVSDLHERKADDVLELLQSSKPDIIAVTGDTFERYSLDENKPGIKPDFSALHRIFVRLIFSLNYFLVEKVQKSIPLTENAYAFLEKAAAIAPVYLSLGNHEEELTDEDTAFLKSKNITLLDNSDICVFVKDAKLRIGGLPTNADEEWLENFSRKDGFKLLLSHHPEYFEPMIKDKNIQLTLSGHNHGGQIKLFGHGVMSAEKKLFPKLDSGFFFGRLIVSAGCSNTAAIPRWGNPRELVVIYLK